MKVSNENVGKFIESLNADEMTAVKAAQQAFCSYDGELLVPNVDSVVMANNLRLVRNAVKVLKRLDADMGQPGCYANVLSLYRLVENVNGVGRQMVNEFSRIASPSVSEAKENAVIASWFLNLYFPANSNVYEMTVPARENIAEMSVYLVYHPEADPFQEA